MLLPRYSVSCKLVEYSWRLRLRNFCQEKSEGSLSLDLSVDRSAEKGRRNRRVTRYVVTRMAKTATTMIAICAPCQWIGHSSVGRKQSAAGWDVQLQSSCFACSFSCRGHLPWLPMQGTASCSTALRYVAVPCPRPKLPFSPKFGQGDCLENEITAWSKVELPTVGSSALSGASGCQIDLLETLEQMRATVLQWHTLRLRRRREARRLWRWQRYCEQSPGAAQPRTCLGTSGGPRCEMPG